MCDNSVWTDALAGNEYDRRHHLGRYSRALVTTTAPEDVLAEVLRRCMGIDPDDNARHDFGDINGGSLQRPSEVATELLRALSDEGFALHATATEEKG